MVYCLLFTIWVKYWPSLCRWSLVASLSIAKRPRQGSAMDYVNLCKSLRTKMPFLAMSDKIPCYQSSASSTMFSSPVLVQLYIVCQPTALVTDYDVDYDGRGPWWWWLTLRSWVDEIWLNSLIICLLFYLIGQKIIPSPNLVFLSLWFALLSAVEISHVAAKSSFAPMTETAKR